MSVEQLKKFYDQVSEDEDLQSQFEGLESEEAVVEKVVELGAEHDFEFSAEDVKSSVEQASAEVKELNESELEDVAGGRIRPPANCAGFISKALREQQ